MRHENLQELFMESPVRVGIFCQAFEEARLTHPTSYFFNGLTKGWRLLRVFFFFKLESLSMFDTERKTFNTFYPCKL